MRIASLILTVCLAGAALSAQAANSQQNKMKDCNAQATQQNLSGDARKTFMKSCLSANSNASSAAGTLTAQQQKMKTCNADAKAKNLTGKDRQTFMSTCLKAQ